MLQETVKSADELGSAFSAKNGLEEKVMLPRAKGTIIHRNALGEILHQEEVYNVITNNGRDFLHTNGYGTAATSNGFNYIALSNDTLTETTASTTLSTEIAANGLARAQATFAHTGGTNTSTLDKTFTCATAPQAAQKAALFTAAAAGTMNHALAFTQRSLQIGDTLQITFTITLG